MDATYICSLYEFDRWANARTLGAVAKLSTEQLIKDMGSSHRSVRDTLVHILSAERVWLRRWNGDLAAQMLDPTKFPSVEALRPAWADLEKEMGALLNSLSDDRLHAVLSYRTLGGEPQAQPLWQQMAHLANHSTYHRGQITTLLRQLGAQPIGTDLIAFFREKSAASAQS
jgi:uncharacterized damage-inducible protein DinB